MIKSILRTLLPKFAYAKLSKHYRQHFSKRVPLHVKDAFGFDLYQNINDVIDYSSFKNCTMDDIPSGKDGKVFQLIKLFLRPGDAAIDVGANIGLMSLFMSKVVGATGQVLAIEPGPVSFALLKRNLFVNGATTNTIPTEAAVSDFNGSINLFINTDGESDNQVHKDMDQYEFRDEKPRPKIQVQAKTLDSIIASKELAARVKFIKIDTEGHEWWVLKGGRNLFTESQDLAVLCEFAPYLKSWETVDVADYYKLIAYGFEVFDAANLSHGPIDLAYLNDNFGFDQISNYTDLLLVKGACRHPLGGVYQLTDIPALTDVRSEPWVCATSPQLLQYKKFCHSKFCPVL